MGDASLSWASVSQKKAPTPTLRYESGYLNTILNISGNTNHLRLGGFRLIKVVIPLPASSTQVIISLIVPIASSSLPSCLQTSAFALELPRLCAPVSSTPYVPKRATLSLGPFTPNSAVMSDAVLAQGEPDETAVQAVVTSPNERLCARFNIAVGKGGLERGNKEHTSLGYFVRFHDIVFMIDITLSIFSYRGPLSGFNV
jgi:hypothetical protein